MGCLLKITKQSYLKGVALTYEKPVPNFHELKSLCNHVLWHGAKRVIPLWTVTVLRHTHHIPANC
jgi:hypothetical protein